MTDDFLAEGIESEKNRVENLIEEVNSVIEERFDIYDSVLEEIDEEIKRQRDRLNRASSSEEDDVRDVLGSLYRERRNLREGVWKDSEAWMTRKLDLERELSELYDAQRMDL